VARGSRIGRTYRDRGLRFAKGSSADFFKAKTSAKLAEVFRPVVEKAMNEVGATKAPNNLMAGYLSMRFPECLNLFAISMPEEIH
jgi:hypothetical protein